MHSVGYHDGVEDVSIFVLAGGRSSRMGSDKALLRLGQQNLLQLMLDKARTIVAEPVIVGARANYAEYGDVIEDLIPGCGPLSGIHAALCTTLTDLNLILSVDMPLMTADFLRWLLQLASTCSDMAVVPRADGRNQPLCASYRRGVRGVAEHALQTGKYRVDDIYSLFPTRFIAANEWLSAGFLPNIFRNINTPGEYESLANMICDVPQTSNAGLKS